LDYSHVQSGMETIFLYQTFNMPVKKHEDKARSPLATAADYPLRYHDDASSFSSDIAIVGDPILLTLHIRSIS